MYPGGTCTGGSDLSPLDVNFLRKKYKVYSLFLNITLPIFNMIYNEQVRHFLIYYLIESLTTENLSIFFNRDEEKEFEISSSSSSSEDDDAVTGSLLSGLSHPYA